MRDVPTLVAVRGEWLHPVGASLAELLAAGRDRLAAALAAAYESEALGSAPSGKLAPVDTRLLVAVVALGAIPATSYPPSD